MKKLLFAVIIVASAAAQSCIGGVSTCPTYAKTDMQLKHKTKHAKVEVPANQTEKAEDIKG